MYWQPHAKPHTPDRLCRRHRRLIHQQKAPCGTSPVRPYNTQRVGVGVSNRLGRWVSKTCSDRPARQCTRTFSPLPSARSTKSKSGVTKAARFLSCCIQNDVGNLWAEHRSIEDRWSRKADRANSRSILYPWRISPPPPTTIPSPALEWADLK